MSRGVVGWSDAVHSVVFQRFKDAGIIACCAILIMLVRTLRSRLKSIPERQ